MEKFLVELTDTELDAVAGGDSTAVGITSDGKVAVLAADDATLTFDGFKITADSLTFAVALSA